jgi:hypothetical protein
LAKTHDKEIVLLTRKTSALGLSMVNGQNVTLFPEAAAKMKSLQELIEKQEYADFG